jgi:hypothetical protein
MKERLRNDQRLFFGFKPMRCYTLSCSFGDDGRLMKGVGASKVARRTPWTGRRRTRRGRENVTTSSKSDEMGRTASREVAKGAMRLNDEDEGRGFSVWGRRGLMLK